MTNVIREDKSVNAENFAFLLAQSNYNLSTVFRSRNHNETIADTPMTSADSSADGSKKGAELEETQSRNHQYQFRILSASTNQISDLKDAEINIVASVYLEGSNNLTLSDVPRLGNQALLSLFSSIELYIDSTLIERIDYPGMSANADFALRYPHSEEAEKVLESNGFITKLKNVFEYGLAFADTFLAAGTAEKTVGYNATDITAVKKISLATGISIGERSGFYAFDNGSVMWSVIAPTGGNHRLRGLITQRIRLGDIFPCISTLPPIFNHSVVVNFTRQSFNDIIASKGIAENVKLNSFIDFKITQDCYIITDELRKACNEYYSKPIETIFTKCKQIPVGFVSEPTANSTMSFNVCVDSAYKNKLAVFCIPRTSNFQNQPATATKYDLTQFEDADTKQYDVAQAPANSYTYGGLKALTVYTMNGVKLFGFDMARDGYVKGKINKYNKIAMLDIKVNPDNAVIANYQCVYKEYLKAREQFGQIAEEGLDYITFLKEYCIYCVDLSCFTIGAGENLRVEMVFDDWDTSGKNYNPYYANNSKASNSYNSKQIYTLFYSDKILRLLPNQNVELADLFQSKSESDETNMI